MTTEFDDESLVAYLDGELSAEQTQQIDQQIANQPQLRVRVQQLRMTWDLLEQLPSEPPSPRFAETTLEMAALTSPPESKSMWSWLTKHALRVFVFALPLLFMAGFLSSQLALNRTDRKLLGDLPILVDWRSLSNIDSIEWLHILADQPDLITAFAGAELGLVGDGDVPIDLQSRREWVEKLTDADRGRLNINLTEFRQQSPNRQAVLRKIIDDVYSGAAHKARFLAAIRAYELLLQEQSMTQRAGLYDLPLADRRIELGKLISLHMAKEYAKKVPAADATAIRDWAEDMTKKYLIVHGNYDALQSVNIELVVNYGACEINMADFEDLAARLSNAAQAILGGLSSSESYVHTLENWIDALARPHEPSLERIGAEKLRELYLNLPGSSRDVIDLLQPEHAKSELRKVSKPRSAVQTGPDRGVSERVTADR